MDPFTPGPRTILAQTCLGCGRLRFGASFGKSDEATNRTCYTCRGLKYRETDGYRRYRRDIQRRYQNESAPTAARKGYPWTGPELEIVSRDDLTVRQMAAMLGRTFAATRAARRAVRIDPRKATMAGRPRASA